ncbi:MAG: DNRLRE domain-containing protein [Chloroflexi bacterium]|nr:DNRLRE domain-containing protein [Chloroflexota bacterium]
MNVKRSLYLIVTLVVAVIIITIFGFRLLNSSAASLPTADNPAPPASPVKLIFIHHSTGGNWLADPNTNSSSDNPGGSLGQELMNNNYFVSATNYGWGPDNIGDQTDIPNWPEWFTDTVMSAVYTETGQYFQEYGTWSRLASDPGGDNEIIMFKSCFPNSDLYGNPDDPPLAEPNDQYTVENAKAVYNHILTYFTAHQDKLFVVIAAPPLMAAETEPSRAINARAFNNWLMNDWLTGYPYNNVAVFDYYNVLTSNGGDVNTNDAGAETGNHHRWWNGAVQHTQTVISNYSAYPSGDSHPTTAGHQKATAEFVQLLNVFYNQWKSGTTASLNLTSPTGGESWTVGTQHAIQWTTGGTVTRVNLHYSTDNFGTSHEISSNIVNSGSYDWTIPDDPSATARVRVQSFISPTTVYDISDPLAILSTSANTYTFDAVITPPNATLPITYTWSSEHLITGQGTSQATYQLDADDGYVITLSAANCGGIFTDTHTITIGAPPLTVAQDTNAQQVMIFQDGVSPSAGYNGTDDVILASDEENVDPNANLGGLDHLETFFGGSEENRRSLMRWDISTLPGDITIDAAAVELYRYDGGPSNPMEIALYRVTREWIEGTGHDPNPGPSYIPDGATWLTATTGTAWTMPGGDYDTTILDQTTMPTSIENAWVRLDATTAVQSWVTGGQSNYGLLLRPLSGDYTYHYYHSREAITTTLRPRLIVTYTTGTPTAAVDLTAPDASTHWPVSSTQQIQWTNTGSVFQVNLFYSADNFVTSNTITLSLANTGSYGWTTPPTPTTSARVRVESVISPTTVYDVSDPFHIESGSVSTSTVYLPLTLYDHTTQPPVCPYPLTGVAISGPTSGPPIQRKERLSADASQSNDFCPPLSAPSGNIVTVDTVAELQSAVNTASSNTTILVADGTYNLNGVFLRFDVPDVTLRSASGNRENVVLDGDYVTTEIIQIVASNVTIADLTLREAYYHPIHVMSLPSSDTLNTLIYNVHIIDPGEQAIKINPHTGENALYFPDSGTIACSHIELTDAGRPHIRNDCYTGGVDAHQARDWIIRDNLIEGFWCASGLSEHGIHLWRSCRDTLVERNEVRNNARGIGFGLASSGDGIRTYSDNPCPGAEGGYIDHYGGIIRNNFVFANNTGLFASQYGFDCGICLWQACGAQAVHNTVASTQAPFSSIEWNLPLSDVDVINNLVTHNLRDRDGVAYQAGNLENQPLSLFTDGNNGDLHLVEGATAAIDQGVPLTAGLCDDDIDGDARPSGSAPDVGADEYLVQLPTLSLIIPTGETSWRVNSVHQIRWTTSESVPDVDLTYSTDSFVTSQTIASSLTNTGVYTWTTPSTPTTSAQVRVASVTSPTVISDTSGLFKLYDPSTFTNTIYLPLILRQYTAPCAAPLTGVTINGPASGSLVAHIFSASVNPSNATLPIVYDWSPEPDSGQGTTNVSYMWTTSGSKIITLTATNCASSSAAVVSDTHTIVVSGTISTGLIQPSDLTYLGAFAYPTSDDWAYSGHALAYYPEGDPAGSSDGYPGSLYAAAHDQNDLVGEISIPAPAIENDFASLPTASVLRPLADITGGWINNCTYNDECIYREVDGLAYLPNTDKIAWNLRDWYNVAAHDQDSLGWSNLDMTGARGVWHIGARPSTDNEFHNAKTCNYLFKAPESFATQHLDGKWLIAGSPREAGALGGSQGPTLYALAPWEDGNPPTSGQNLDALALLYYPEIYPGCYDNPDECHFPNYRATDYWGGGAWVQTESKSGILIVGKKGLGDNCYGTQEECANDPCNMYKGYHAYPYQPQILFYDPEELVDVVAGTKEPWDVVPYAVYSAVDNVFDSECATLSAAAYDQVHQLVYITEREAGPSGKTAVHVWKVN